MQLYVSLPDEIYHFSWLAHSAGAADSLQVLLGRFRIFKLDDVAHIHRVQASRAQVIADQHGYLALMQQIQGAVAHLQRNLLRVVIKGQGHNVCMSQLFTDSIQFSLVLAKDDDSAIRQFAYVKITTRNVLGKSLLNLGQDLPFEQVYQYLDVVVDFSATILLNVHVLVLDMGRHLAVGLAFEVDDVGEGALQLIDKGGLHRRPCEDELSSHVTLNELSAGLFFVLCEESLQDQFLLTIMYLQQGARSPAG